jgi:hypothetical protein
MQQPGLELKAMFDAVAESFSQATTKRRLPQVPVMTDKLVPNFYFREALLQPLAGPSTSPPAPLTSLASALPALEVTPDGFLIYTVRKGDSRELPRLRDRLGRSGGSGAYEERWRRQTNSPSCEYHIQVRQAMDLV